MKVGLVSVVIPARNAERYIQSCIESVQSQSYRDLEIIIVLNDSGDRSEAICKKIATADPRVLVKSIVEPGVSNARNIGLDMSSGEYIMFVDADDLIHAGLIDRSVKEMNQHEVTIVTTGIEKYHFDLLGTERDASLSEVVTAYDYAKRMLLGARGYYGYACCKLYRVDAIGKIRFDTKLSFSEDTDFLLRVLEEDGRIFLSSLVGYFYSQDTDGVTRDRYGEKRMRALPIAKGFSDYASDDVMRRASECYYWRNAYYTLSQSKLSPTNQKKVWSIMVNYRMRVILAVGSPIKYRLIAASSFLGKYIFLGLAARLK